MPLFRTDTLLFVIRHRNKEVWKPHSFVKQYEENLKKDKKPDQRQIQKYYKTIQAYIEKKHIFPLKRILTLWFSLLACLGFYLTQRL